MKTILEFLQKKHQETIVEFDKDTLTRLLDEKILKDCNSTKMVLRIQGEGNSYSRESTSREDIKILSNGKITRDDYNFQTQEITIDKVRESIELFIDDILQNYNQIYMFISLNKDIDCYKYRLWENKKHRVDSFGGANIIGFRFKTKEEVMNLLDDIAKIEIK